MPIAGLGHLYTWNVFSPRLGLTAKLTGDARTILRASYRRFNAGVLTGELDPIHPGVTATTTMAFDQATGGYTKFVSKVDPIVNLSIDPNTRTPHSDEYSVAVDREIAAGMRASVAYIRRRGSDYIGWTDIGGQYRQDTRTVNGIVVPVFVLTNSTADRRFFLTNPDSLFLHYDGLVLSMERRMSSGWQASGSYTYSKTYGTLVDEQCAGRRSAVQHHRAPGVPELRPGSERPDERGGPPAERLAAHLQDDGRRSLAVATDARRQLPVLHRPAVDGDDSAVAGAGQPADYAGDARTRRLSAQSLLDLRISKTVALPKAGTVDVLFDVLNLLNDTAEEAIQSDNLTAATFGRATQFMDPRRVMIGVRLNLGR